MLHRLLPAVLSVAFLLGQVTALSHVHDDVDQRAADYVDCRLCQAAGSDGAIGAPHGDILPAELADRVAADVRLAPAAEPARTRLARAPPQTVPS